jgi:hypothetical protein
MSTFICSVLSHEPFLSLLLCSVVFCSGVVVIIPRICCIRLGICYLFRCRSRSRHVCQRSRPFIDINIDQQQTEGFITFSYKFAASVFIYCIGYQHQDLCLSPGPSLSKNQKNALCSLSVVAPLSLQNSSIV